MHRENHGAAEPVCGVKSEVADPCIGLDMNNIRHKQAQHELMGAEMRKVINTVTKERLYALKFEHSNYRPQENMLLPEWLRKGR